MCENVEFRGETAVVHMVAAYSGLRGNDKRDRQPRPLAICAFKQACKASVLAAPSSNLRALPQVMRGSATKRQF